MRGPAAVAAAAAAVAAEVAVAAAGAGVAWGNGVGRSDDGVLERRLRVGDVRP
jgi:hypothetical protein